MIESGLPVSQDGVARVVIRGAAVSQLRLVTSAGTLSPSIVSSNGDVVATFDDVAAGGVYALDAIDESGERWRLAFGVLVEASRVVAASTLFHVGAYRFAFGDVQLDELEDSSLPAGQYVHVQDEASTQWTIVHGLGGYPPVTVVDSALRVVEGDVAYIDENTIQLNFSAAFGGRAFIGG